jgi:hypothetical protein
MSKYRVNFGALQTGKKKTPASGAGAKSTFEGREEKTLRMNATDSQP